MADRFAVGRAELPSMRRHVRKAALPAPTHEWVTDRAQRASEVAGVPSDLWLIHGNLYDLSKFEHPGGREWLDLTRGTDCTAEFEVHHIHETKVLPLLRKYHVRACPDAAKIAAYTFEENGFYKTLKRAVAAEFAGECGPTPAMYALSALAVALWALAFLNMLSAQTALSAIIAGIALYPMFGVGHNWFHMRNTLWRYAFDLTCFGHHDWRISHAISHHVFPNLDVDIEASFVEPFLTFMRDQKPNLPGVLLVWVLFTMLIAPLEFARRIIALSLGAEHLRWEFAVPIVLGSACAVCGGWWGVFLFFLHHFVANLGLVIISTPVHRGKYSWTSGCEAVRAARTDFGEHTVIATNDFCVEEFGLFAKLFVGGSFNDHVTHHLFPTVCLSQQHRVRKIFLEHCKKFNVPYVKTSFPDMLLGLFQVLRRNPGELLYVPLG
eukprot:m.5468 g.5468  ORF g.5468 m.5468 type:complete len:437 (-) comp2008_c0_seq1:94-1404(-)